MNVKKIFITLITIVACVVIGALVLNTLLPNVTKSLINATEDMIYDATKLKFDFNNDGVKPGGDDATKASAKDYNGGYGNTITDVDVQGFTKTAEDSNSK